MKDLYKALGVNIDASPIEIKKQYRKLAKKYHPDANPNNDKAAEIFKEITEAYKILSNNELKTEYDRKREKNANQQGFRNEENRAHTEQKKQQTNSTHAKYTGNPYEEAQSAFAKFFKFDPGSNEHQYAEKKDKNPMNTDELFESFFSARKKR